MAKEIHNALAGSHADDPTVTVFKGLLMLPKNYVTKQHLPITDKQLKKAIRHIANGTAFALVEGRMDLRETVTKADVRQGAGRGVRRSAQKIANRTDVRKVFARGGLVEELNGSLRK